MDKLLLIVLIDVNGFSPPISDPIFLHVLATIKRKFCVTVAVNIGFRSRKYLNDEFERLAQIAVSLKIVKSILA